MIRAIVSSKWKSNAALVFLALPILAFARGGLFDDLASFATSGLSAPSTQAGARQSNFPASADFSRCAHLFPGGRPIDLHSISAQWRPTALCSSAFAVVYSGLSKTPIVAVERLSRSSLSSARAEPRTDSFYPDERLARSARAELGDYSRSGFDRGHLSPAADQPTAVAMEESFALSNIVPQDPIHNRKVWSKIESDTRHYVRRAHGDVFVFTGVLFLGAPRTIGRNEVWVPTHMFKLVYDPATNRAWAHVLPNSSDARIGPPISYRDFVALSGMDLLDASLTIWPSAQRAGRQPVER